MDWVTTVWSLNKLELIFLVVRQCQHSEASTALALARKLVPLNESNAISAPLFRSCVSLAALPTPQRRLAGTSHLLTHEALLPKVRSDQPPTVLLVDLLLVIIDVHHAGCRPGRARASGAQCALGASAECATSTPLSHARASTRCRGDVGK